MSKRTLFLILALDAVTLGGVLVVSTLMYGSPFAVEKAWPVWVVAFLFAGSVQAALILAEKRNS